MTLRRLAEIVVPVIGLSTAILTAVQEQLGLRLQPASARMQVFVIDDAQRPSPD